MILVVAALKQELEPYFDKQDVLYTGIGKINAAYSLTRALKNSCIDLVVNFGTAASARYPKGTIVQCTRISERDMNCPLPEFTKTNPSILRADVSLTSLNYEFAQCYTGDSFLNYFQCQPYDGVIDMEAFALAKVCEKFTTPFLCFKAVTDGMGTDSESEWRENMNKSAKEFKEIYDLINR